jgi:hypothetical protein
MVISIFQYLSLKFYIFKFIFIVNIYKNIVIRFILFINYYLIIIEISPYLITYFKN